MSEKIEGFDAVTSTHMPLSERVLDRLGDILFASDEILDMLSTGRAPADETARTVEELVRRVYDQVNELMKRLAD